MNPHKMAPLLQIIRTHFCFYKGQQDPIPLGLEACVLKDYVVLKRGQEGEDETREEKMKKDNMTEGPAVLRPRRWENLRTQ